MARKYDIYLQYKSYVATIHETSLYSVEGSIPQLIHDHFLS